MPKINSLAFATVLAIVAASFWFKANLSETAAHAWHEPVNSVPMDDRQLKADMKLMPLPKADGMTFVFSDTECAMDAIEATSALCTTGVTGGHW